MKVRITFECDDGLRRAINHHYGREGKASYEDIKNWFRNYGHSADDDIRSELEEDERGETT